MFDPLKSISLGPFQLYFQIIAIVVAIIIAFLVLTNRLKRIVPVERESISNHLQTSLIIAIVLYKFWPFILSPGLIKTPSNLIFYSGGPYALAVALIGAGIWFGFKWWKLKWSFALLDELSLSMLFGWITYLMMIKQYGKPSPFSFGWDKEGVMLHPVNLYEVIILAMFVIVAFYWVEQSRKGARTVYFIIAIILTQTLVAPF